MSIARIAYRNVHGEFNTGLPDYFVLVILEDLSAESASAQRWGHPYSDAWVVNRISLDELEEQMRSSKYR